MVYGYHHIILLLVAVNFLLCLIYKLNFVRLCMYKRKNVEDLWGSILSALSSIHWGSWNIFLLDKGGAPVLKISLNLSSTKNIFLYPFCFPAVFNVFLLLSLDYVFLIGFSQELQISLLLLIRISELNPDCIF